MTSSSHLVAIARIGRLRRGWVCFKLGVGYAAQAPHAPSLVPLTGNNLADCIWVDWIRADGDGARDKVIARSTHFFSRIPAERPLCIARPRIATPASTA